MDTPWNTINCVDRQLRIWQENLSFGHAWIGSRDAVKQQRRCAILPSPPSLYLVDIRRSTTLSHESVSVRTDRHKRQICDLERMCERARIPCYPSVQTMYEFSSWAND